MPFYLFKCEKCNEEIEELQKYEDPIPQCQKCHIEMNRQITATGFIRKGAGLYSVDTASTDKLPDME